MLADLKRLRRDSGRAVAAATVIVGPGRTADAATITLPPAASAAHSGAAPTAAAVVPPRTKSWRIVLAAAAVMALMAAAGVLWRLRAMSPAVGAGGKTSLAVFYFDNNTGNAQLDWLRSGLTDMLVTDLSQSPDVEVLGTDRLQHILTALNRQDAKTVSFDTVQELAKRAGVTTVLLGSFVKSGETIRINTKLQDAASGRILDVERADAVGDANLFPAVDELTRRIRSKMSRAKQRAQVDADVKDLTTSNVDAYKNYLEAVKLVDESRERDAAPLLERAVGADPQFASAVEKLAEVEGRLGDRLKAGIYGRRAFELRDRLPPRERSYVEGLYYAERATTVSRAIEAFKKTLAAYPDHDEATENLALSYAFLGQPDAADRLMADLAKRRPADSDVALTLASLCLYRGRTGDATAALGAASPTAAAALADEMKRPRAPVPGSPAELTDAAARVDAVVRLGPQQGATALAYVRALYQLAGIRERQGDAEQARQLYARYANLWKDADVDRDRVREAARKSGA